MRPGLGVQAELLLRTGRVGEQLLRHLDRQLVGGQVLGDVGAVLILVLDVRPVASDPQVDPLADLERRQLACVDLAELADGGLQSLLVVPDPK